PEEKHMRKLVVGTFLTVDGVMQAPGGPDEDRDGGFEHGGWSVKYWDEMMGKLIIEQTLQSDALLLGRKTYEIFAAHWPRVTDPKDPVASKLNSMRKYVASRTLTKVEWQNSTLLRGVAALRKSASLTSAARRPVLPTRGRGCKPQWVCPQRRETVWVHIQQAAQETYPSTGSHSAMTQKTPAIGARAAKAPVAPMTIERRDPGPRDVEIEILYCGICHSDVHKVNDDWGTTQFPVVPGHEIVGRVVS